MVGKITKQRLTQAKVIALLLSTVGLGLILGTNFQGINILGAALGLGAAFAYTAYLIYGKRVTGDHPPLVTSGYIIAFAALGYTAKLFLSPFAPSGRYETIQSYNSTFSLRKWPETLAISDN